MIPRHVVSSGVLLWSRSRRLYPRGPWSDSRVKNPTSRMKWSGLLTVGRASVDNGPDAVEAPGICGAPSESKSTKRRSRRVPPEKGTCVAKRVTRGHGTVGPTGRRPRTESGGV
jgi:hypothetical protein